MPKSINKINIAEPRSTNEKMWFSVIRDIICDLDYGSVELRITVKGGMVMNVKEKSEKSYSIHNEGL